MISDSGLCYCDICKQGTPYSGKYSVCVSIRRRGKIYRFVVSTCYECAKSICDWLLSLPNIPVEYALASVAVNGENEIVDAPIEYKDLKIISRWLCIDIANLIKRNIANE